MPQPHMPLATMLGVAKDKGWTHTLVVGRDSAGKVQVGNSGGTGEEILSLLRDATTMLERRLSAGHACDPVAAEAVRQSGENGAKSHAATA